MVKRLWSWLPGLLAGLLAFSLPFTSFPLVARLTGSSMVAPLALLPLAALLVIWLIPHLARRGGLPPQVVPLLAFTSAALVSCAAAFFRYFPAYKSATLGRSELEALATLAVGISFYLVISRWADRSERVCLLLRWINWGGLLMLAWCLGQALIWYTLRAYPDWMWTLQGYMSNSLLLYPQRVNGLAYEPSWLAHQLNMIYLPLWLASVVTGFSAHRLRVWKITFEHILLVGGAAMLVLSVSRVGWLTFLFMLAFLMLLWNIGWVRGLQARLFRNHPAGERHTRWLRRGFVLLSILALLLVYAGLFAGAGYSLSRLDPTRMAKLFDFSMIREQSFFHWANQLVFAERIVFWQAGWEVFNSFPILGTGLGNSGFFFPEKLSAFSFSLTEVRTLLYQLTALPNIKSLWVRLLAETGIVGLALFVSWLFVLWCSAAYLRSRGGRLYQMIGLAGSFVLLGLIIEGFSLDTFALPYYWVSLGLLTSVTEVARGSYHGPEGSTREQP